MLCVYANLFEGISGVHFGEAHGGYTFCGYAALYLLGETRLIDEAALLVRQLEWLIFIQVEVVLTETKARRGRISRKTKQASWWMLFLLDR